MQNVFFFLKSRIVYVGFMCVCEWDDKICYKINVKI